VRFEEITTYQGILRDLVETKRGSGGGGTEPAVSPHRCRQVGEVEKAIDFLQNIRTRVSLQPPLLQKTVLP